MLPLDKIMTYTTFCTVELNPPVEQTMFRVSFPDGTFVDDHVAKMLYKVGDPVDEDQAVYEFMLRHGFTGVTGVIALLKRQMALWQYILMGVGIIMILAALYMMLLKWIKRRRQ